jgi:outer membrane receptor for ferrienterochelin and colicin
MDRSNSVNAVRVVIVLLCSGVSAASAQTPSPPQPDSERPTQPTERSLETPAQASDQGAPEAPANLPPDDFADATAADGALADDGAAARTTTEDASGDIVVTGSRLKRTAFSSSSPVTVVSREDLERQGYSDLSELARGLNEGGGNNTGGSGSTTGGGFYQGQGVQMINLRGLGPNATLVLINGRRLLADGPGGALENFSNISTIPVSMIERIEVLRGGASAIYGSDAVAGVVNIITRKKLDGLHLEANALSTDKLDHQQYSANISLGASTDTTSVSVGLNWWHSTQLAASDRDWTEGQYQATIGPMGLYVPIARQPLLAGAAPEMQPGFFSDDIGNFELFPDPQCPDPDGFLTRDQSARITALEQRVMQLPMGSDMRDLLERQIVQLKVARRFQGRHKANDTIPYLASAGFWPESAPAGSPRGQQRVIYNDANGFGCGWQTRDYQVILPEETRINSMLFASHDFTDHLEVKLEAQYANSRTKQMTLPTPAYINGLAAAFTPNYAYDDNTPWTLPLTGTDGTVYEQSLASTLYYGYPFDYGAPAHHNRYEAQSFRSVLALGGDFADAAAGSVAETWEWEVAGTYSRSTWDSRLSDFNSQDVSRALNACNLAPDGTLLAMPGLENTPENRRMVGCFNPFYTAFTDPMNAGNAPGLIDDLLTEVTQYTVSELYTADLNLTGALLELPGGDLKFAVGGQYRYEQRRSDHDNDTNQNRTNFYTAIDDTDNSRNIWSAYGELNIPIIQALELQPAVRYEVYEQAGSALSPQVGAIVSLGKFFDEPAAAIENLRLRATYAQAFRAPNLAQTDDAACSFLSEFAYSPRTHPDPAIRRTQTTQLITGKVCGNGGLSPEKSDSYSAGIDWTWGGLHAQADYWVYDYRERIIQPVMQRLLDRNANRAYCLINRADADMLATQSAEGQALVRNINTNAPTGYFDTTSCADVARKEGVAEGSLSADEFIARFGDELRYLDTTGTPRAPVLRYENASEVNTDGLDFALMYSLSADKLGLSSDIGTLGFGIQGSYVFNFMYRESPADPTVDCGADPEAASCEREAAGNRNIRNFNHVLPRLRFTVPISYAIDVHKLALTGRYIGGFEDDAVSQFNIYDAPDKQVSAFVVFDAQYAVDLGRAIGTPAEWRLGVQNLFDSAPPRIRQWDTGGFEPSIHDARGRLFYTRLTVDL